MDEHSRTGAQPRGTPGRAEVIGYGLLATAVAAGVLYLDGQRTRDITIIAVAILALLVTLVLVAPRLGEPERQDVAPHAGNAGHAGPATRDPGSLPPERAPTTDPPPDPPTAPGLPTAPDPTAEPATSSPDPGSNTPAGPAKAGRRAKRGRRRR